MALASKLLSKKSMPWTCYNTKLFFSLRGRVLLGLTFYRQILVHTAAPGRGAVPNARNARPPGSSDVPQSLICERLRTLSELTAIPGMNSPVQADVGSSYWLSNPRTFFQKVRIVLAGSTASSTTMFKTPWSKMMNSMPPVFSAAWLKRLMPLLLSLSPTQLYTIRELPSAVAGSSTNSPSWVDATVHPFRPH